VLLVHTYYRPLPPACTKGGIEGELVLGDYSFSCSGVIHLDWRVYQVMKISYQMFIQGKMKVHFSFLQSINPFS
jgi:hypothetical protein